jgi:hypothetical protein
MRRRDVRIWRPHCACHYPPLTSQRLHVSTSLPLHVLSCPLFVQRSAVHALLRIKSGTLQIKPLDCLRPSQLNDVATFFCGGLVHVVHSSTLARRLHLSSYRECSPAPLQDSRESFRQLPAGSVLENFELRHQRGSFFLPAVCYALNGTGARCRARNSGACWRRLADSYGIAGGGRQGNAQGRAA